MINDYLKELLADPVLLRDAFEERAAILEYDAGYPREQAEKLAAKMYGFGSKYRLYHYCEDLEEKTNG